MTPIEITLIICLVFIGITPWVYTCAYAIKKYFKNAGNQDN